MLGGAAAALENLPPIGLRELGVEVSRESIRPTYPDPLPRVRGLVEGHHPGLLLGKRHEDDLPDRSHLSGVKYLEDLSFLDNKAMVRHHSDKLLGCPVDLIDRFQGTELGRCDRLPQGARHHRTKLRDRVIERRDLGGLLR